MKKLKAYFHMMITALICLAMSLLNGKRNERTVKGLKKIVGFNGNTEKTFLVKGNIIRNRDFGSNILSGKEIAVNMYHLKGETMPGHPVSVCSMGPGDRIISMHLPRADNLKAGKRQKNNPPPLTGYTMPDERKIIAFPINESLYFRRRISGTIV